MLNEKELIKLIYCRCRGNVSSDDERRNVTVPFQIFGKVDVNVQMFENDGPGN